MLQCKNNFSSIVFLVVAMLLFSINSCRKNELETSASQYLIVSFNSNGGTLVSDKIVQIDSFVKMPPSPRKVGYYFTGWYSNENKIFDSTKAIKNNLSVFAKWTLFPKVRLTLKTNKGDIIDTQILDRAYDVPYRITNPKQKNLVFINWFTDTNYTTLYDFNKKINRDSIVYALWRPAKIFKLIYNTCGGIPIDTLLLPEDATMQEVSSPQKFNFIFEGWYGDSTYKDDLFIKFNKQITKDTILYAKWKPLIYYFVRFNTNGGNEIAPVADIKEGNTLYLPNDPLKSGYRFLNWFYDSTFKYEFNNNTAIFGNLTLYAKWELSNGLTMKYRNDYLADTFFVAFGSITNSPLAIVANNPSGTPVNYILEGTVPNGISINPNNGQLTCNGSLPIGSYLLKVTPTNSLGLGISTKVIIKVLSNENRITSFNFDRLFPTVTGVIVGTTINLLVPYITNITDLTPSIVLSASTASVIPNNNLSQNFSTNKTYVVTAESGEIRNYTVIVTREPSKAPKIIKVSSTETLTDSIYKSYVGETVFISGINFSNIQNENSVTFNGAPATIISSTTNKLSLKIPTNATSGNLIIAVNGSAIEQPFVFYIGPTINLVSLPYSGSSPSSGITSENIDATIMLTGKNYSNIASKNIVTFQSNVNRIQANVINATATTLTCIVPPNTTLGKIEVTNLESNLGPVESPKDFTAKYLVSFYPNGGTFTHPSSSTDTKTVYLEWGSIKVEPSDLNSMLNYYATKNGYSLTWFSDASLSIPINWPFTIVGTKSIYAKWTAVICDTTNERNSLIQLARETQSASSHWHSPWDTLKALPINLDGTNAAWKGVSTNAEGCVTKLELENNNLEGSVPIVIGNFRNLSLLNLSRNLLSGIVPAELANLTNLKNLNLSGNNISSLGNTIDLLSSLISLNLSNNPLSGSLSAALCNGAYALFNIGGLTCPVPTVSVVAGTSIILDQVLTNPTGIIKDGNIIYVASRGNNQIKTVDITTGLVSIFAGTGVAGNLHNQIAKDNFQFNNPYGIVKTNDKYYVTNHADHSIIEINGNIAKPYSGSGYTSAPGSPYDGAINLARYKNPAGMAVDPESPNFIYVADFGNNTIREIKISTGQVKTIAGDAENSAGSQEGTLNEPASILFNNPVGLVAKTIAGVRKLFIAEEGNNAIRVLNLSDWSVNSETIAGGNGVGNEDGIGGNAKFNSPNGIGIDVTSENLYVADKKNHRIRKINIATKSVSTYSGSSQGDQTGGATIAKYNYPSGIIVADNGIIYISDTDNKSIKKIVPATH